MRILNGVFDISPNKSLKENFRWRWSDTSWRSCDFTLMYASIGALNYRCNMRSPVYRRYVVYCNLTNVNIAYPYVIKMVRKLIKPRTPTPEH